MGTVTRVGLAALLVVFALAPIADADTIYSYVGDTFRTVSGVYTLADRITGSFTLCLRLHPGRRQLLVHGRPPDAHGSEFEWCLFAQPVCVQLLECRGCWGTDQLDLDLQSL
jgi:hypothetical protein